MALFAAFAKTFKGEKVPLLAALPSNTTNLEKQLTVRNWLCPATGVRIIANASSNLFSPFADTAVELQAKDEGRKTIATADVIKSFKKIGHCAGCASDFYTPSKMAEAVTAGTTFRCAYCTATVEVKAEDMDMLHDGGKPAGKKVEPRDAVDELLDKQLHRVAEAETSDEEEDEDALPTDRGLDDDPLDKGTELPVEDTATNTEEDEEDEDGEGGFDDQLTNDMADIGSEETDAADAIDDEDELAAGEEAEEDVDNGMEPDDAESAEATAEDPDSMSGDFPDEGQQGDEDDTDDGSEDPTGEHDETAIEAAAPEEGEHADETYIERKKKNMRNSGDLDEVLDKQLHRVGVESSDEFDTVHQGPDEEGGPDRDLPQNVTAAFQVSAFTPLTAKDMKSGKHKIALVLGGGETPVWHVFVNNMPVAMCHQVKASDAIQDIFTDVAAFRKAFAAATRENGLSEEVVSSFGMKPIVVTVQPNKVFAQAVSAAVAKHKQRYTEMQAAMDARYEQALSMALLGVSKGFFTKREDPIRQEIIAALEAIEVEQPQDMINSIYATHVPALVKTVLTLARDLAKKNDDTRNQLSEAIASASFITPGSKAGSALRQRLQQNSVTVSAASMLDDTYIEEQPSRNRRVAARDSDDFLVRANAVFAARRNGAGRLD